MSIINSMDIYIEIGEQLKTAILWGIFWWGFLGAGRTIIKNK